MKELKLTKELHDYIEDAIEKHNELTHNGVDFGDILFSYFNNDSFEDDAHLLILNDWDEGKSNDPFWNQERDEHSAICFIVDMCIYLFENGQY